MTNTIDTFSEREEIEMLLPWYATGKLSAEDRARVARYLATHPEMAHQLGIVTEEVGSVVRDNEVISAPRGLATASEIAGAGVRARADAGGVMQSLLSGLRDLFLVPSTGGVRWAGAAAALLILAQAGLIGALMRGPGSDAFQPASGGVTQAADGAFALVRFADGAAAQDVAALLTRLGMSITDGPKAGGLYRVRIGEAALTGPVRAERIAALKAAAGIVVLATPAP